MSKQSIFIGPNGAVTSLRVAPSKGLSLQRVAKAQIDRVSDIRFDEDTQQFYIVFLSAPLPGARDNHRGEWTVPESLCVLENEHGKYISHQAPLSIHYFEEYEEAVAREVELINELRAQHGADFI